MCSINVRDAKTQLVALVQCTAVSVLSVGGYAFATRDQALPFYAATSARRRPDGFVKSPTATQRVRLIHDTPANRASGGPIGFGLDVTDHDGAAAACSVVAIMNPMLQHTIATSNARTLIRGLVSASPGGKAP